MAAKSNTSKFCCCFVLVLPCLTGCLTYIYSRWLLEKNGCTEQQDVSTWSRYTSWFTTRNTTPNNICDLWQWQTHWTVLTGQLSEWNDKIKFNDIDTLLSGVLGLLVVSILIFGVFLCCRACGYKKGNKSAKTTTDVTPYTSPAHSRQHAVPQTTEHFHVRRFLLCVVILSMVLSIPWEFVRLYQKEVAKRAAVASQGAPEECKTGSTSLVQSIKLFVKWQFSWSGLDQCENYYYTLLVDPLWELTPLLVISSAVTRCLLHPIELLFSSLGRSFRAFFVEIPVQWQPVLLVLLTLILLVVILMMCSYRLHVPLLFKIEPKTPVFVVDSSHPVNSNQNSRYIQSKWTSQDGSYTQSPDIRDHQIKYIPDNQSNFYVLKNTSLSSTNKNDSYDRANQNYLYSDINNYENLENSSEISANKISTPRKYKPRKVKTTSVKNMDTSAKTTKSQTSKQKLSSRKRYEDDPDFPNPHH